MEDINIIDIEGSELKDGGRGDYSIACFEDVGGLMCNGKLYGNMDAFEEKPTKFYVHKEEGKYYIKCGNGHFLSIIGEGQRFELDCSQVKPEGDQVVDFEPSSLFRSIFRFKTKDGKYVGVEWVKANCGILKVYDREACSSYFYLK